VTGPLSEFTLSILLPARRGDKIDNLSHLLPATLSIKGQPMSLDNHFAFRPLFATHVVPCVTYVAGRQVGKTRSVAARLILDSALHPGTESLVITPLQEQSDRLSSVIFRPMIEDSPVRAVLRPDGGAGNVRRREFANRSFIHFLYAFLDAERVRGASARIVYPDELQDIDPSFLPVIFSCQDGQDEPVVIQSGTAKTKDTALEAAWETSSQGIWHVKCGACGFDNRYCLEPEGHLIAVTGPVRSDVCEDRPGTLCKGCRIPINARDGRWVHRYPERLLSHQGYHVPQQMMPGHFARPLKWATLNGKMNGERGFTTGKFYNEVLGVPYDVAVKLLSVEDLRAAAKGVGPNTESDAELRAKSGRYIKIVIGIDWGGGGEDGASRTKYAACGLRGDGTAEIFFGSQFPPSTDRVGEAQEILRVARKLRADILAHDYNGVGTASESAMTHLGWPLSAIAPITYRAGIGGKLLTYHKTGGNRVRGFYSLDKAESLQYLCSVVRDGWVRFFDYDHIDTGRPGLLHDFTALVEDEVETPTGRTYRIRKGRTAASDDFAHAVNYGLMALWEMTRSWPRLSTGLVGP
jgi:hypothetical protein